MSRFFLLIAATSGFLAVMLGAFAAHALKNKLDSYALGIFQTGVTYQMYHALALLGVAILLSLYPGKLLQWAGYSFIVGTLLFCGSLYWLAFGAPRWVGPITPLGGTGFLIGWLCLASAALQWKGINPA